MKKMFMLTNEFMKRIYYYYDFNTFAFLFLMQQRNNILTFT